MTLAKAISEDRISKGWRGSAEFKIGRARHSEPSIVRGTGKWGIGYGGTELWGAK